MPRGTVSSSATSPSTPELSRDAYDVELHRLQVELVKLQEWVKATGAKVVVVFEGRDGAGKGGTINRITEHLNPRVVSVVALPTPTGREQGQWYFQRYVAHLPATGEIVLFDRSWYNRAGVERVMGFCTDAEYELFLAQCPTFEHLLLEAGILLRKYWFSVSDDEQERRFEDRLRDPLKRWKLSPVDLEARRRWVEFSKAKDAMFAATDTDEAPWIVVPSDSKRHARLNCIAHLLSTVPYVDVFEPSIDLPERQRDDGYERPAPSTMRYVPDHVASMLEG